jgi:hypothetical protein
VNRKDEDGLVSNETLLRKALSFTYRQITEDHNKSRKEGPLPYPADGLRTYPLNIAQIAEIETDLKERFGGHLGEYEDVFRVTPGRSQIRSMLIFARKET